MKGAETRARERLMVSALPTPETIQHEEHIIRWEIEKEMRLLERKDVNEEKKKKKKLPLSKIRLIDI